ncbi:ergothioneine biosynthesis protein EgtB [Novosphingobium pentaromativorans]|uniref:Ergothioneine biosynthesis protein EgtB n=1 Tax=Novosphingobium pentaromativorans US6-1 TaxID=1088721 RepID=G6E8F9_9SPHN|nr:ergothioneine biosynthesis protein EgtB [Novosphingobium pentaromativorans]AIT81353.1 hypothetical protein JI59_16960 [Novosphingobium pentaromativorans US6-1]EHJ62499.1 hypothetical protein NSU_0630 [Novosphingobium pentaromativorans US6-1]
MDLAHSLSAAGRSRSLSERFRALRSASVSLVSPLSDADATIQSMPDASPAKWHLAHTTWFFETFLLRDHLNGYGLFDERWPYLFNSYYEAEGERHARAARGMLSRPSLDEVLDYRAHVDAAMEGLLERDELADLIALGIAHEEQHQELLLTDIKHALWRNPLGPAYGVLPEGGVDRGLGDQGWIEHPGGIARIGHKGPAFAFDNEGPSHRVLLEPFALSRRLVTNREWDAFIADGGYRTAGLWLSDGWAWVQENAIAAPLYWREGEAFTLGGWRDRDPDAPVTHISHYEADAFATWAGLRLPTEFEWEVAARDSDPSAGVQWDGGAVNPSGTDQLFGDCWQWTRSAYLPYPRFRPAEGAVGEYNGKFMSGQCVLKGASCATPRGHSRATYRNFFQPYQRWQFTGLRLARDL